MGQCGKENVELGFLDEAEPFLLKSRFFPSKVGGVPAWLSLKPLPTTEKLACGVCSKPTAFLMQIYAPDSAKSETFHRTIFVFVCRDESCCKPNNAENFRVFRSQLPRHNEFYSATPPEETPVDSEPEARLFNNICAVCGCLGLKTCGKCHQAHYCGKTHQGIHWKAGHKFSCGTNATQSDKTHDWLFPEMEISTEAEDFTEDKNKTEKDSEEKLKEYKEYIKTHGDEEVIDSPILAEKELDKMASTESENDKQLRRFKKRLALDPEQVLRYQKGGDPLWIAVSPKPAQAPDCRCGAKRQFEFQVLPQLLSHLKVDKVGTSLDWGTLCVYTCKDNCSTGNQYKDEYIFKQDVA